MLLAIILIIVILALFYYYMTWADGYYAGINVPDFGPNPDRPSEIITLKTPDEKRTGWWYAILPPRAIANSYMILFYNYHYLTSKYLR